MTLEVAMLIREDFLPQNGFTLYDRYCPLYKSTWMMRVIVEFFDNAVGYMKEHTWSSLKSSQSDLLYRVRWLKFEV